MDKKMYKKIRNANRANPYVDITPYELQMGFPIVSYPNFFPQMEEVIVYVAPANTFVDKEQVVGYTGRSAGVSVRVAKGVSLRTGGSGGKPIRSNVRKYHFGDLIITNKRILFIGKDDRFEFAINKISAIKMLDRTSFIIQSGKSSKNVSLDESLVPYAYGFINYVINESNKGVDIYRSIVESQSNEQIAICNQTIQEAMSLKIGRRKGKKKSKPLIFILLGIIVLAIISNQGNNAEGNIGTSLEGVVSYSDTELLGLVDHPQIYDDYEASKSFYSEIDTEKVKVLDIASYYSLQGKLKSLTDDEVLLYLIQHSRVKDKVGTLHINLFSPELCNDMTVEKAIELLVGYLPSDFMKYYNKDISYQHGNEDITFYTYSCRLNEAGVEYHNNGHSEYSYYYYFRITHYIDSNQWSITTGYAAYGGKGLGWIEKYADPWEIDISNYIE